MTTYKTPICVFEREANQDKRDEYVRKAISALPQGYVPISIHWPSFIGLDGEIIDNSDKNKFYIEYAKIL